MIELYKKFKFNLFTFTVSLILVFFINTNNLFANLETKKVRNLCSNIFIKGKDSISLNKNEKILVCGSNEVPEWNQIPLNQAWINLNIILKNKGYFFSTPTFKSEKLIIDLNLPSYINNLSIVWNRKFNLLESNLFSYINKNFKNKKMTGKIIKDIDDKVNLFLKSNGLACPSYELKLDPFSNSMILKINTRQTQRFDNYKILNVKEISPLAIKRYKTFKTGQLFNSHLLTLYSRRLKRSGLVEWSDYDITCKNGHVDIVHIINIGRSNLVRLGLGLSTEEALKGSFMYENGRLNSLGSQIQLIGEASVPFQTLTAFSNIFLSSEFSKTSIVPSIEIRREDQKIAEFSSLKTKIGIKRIWDNGKEWKESSFGLAKNYLNMDSGIGPANPKFTTFEFEHSILDHMFEIFNQAPKHGYHLNLKVIGSFSFLDSPFNIFDVSLSGTHIYSSNSILDRRLILSLRWKINTLFLENPEINFENLPVIFRKTLGGSKSLRGFNRNEINNFNSGFPSIIFFGLEGRFTNSFIYKLEPLIFLDVGITSDQALKFKKPIYYSPGLGIRRESLLGTIRATLAYGFSSLPKANEEGGLNFYFSLGKEF